MKQVDAVVIGSDPGGLGVAALPGECVAASAVQRGESILRGV
ncbi:MAG: hypothetical protein ACWGSD_17500 [Thermodesulfobacteriota bacterium]